MSDQPRRVLLLDVMGTLVVEPFYEVVPKALGMSLEELYEVKHPSAWVDFEHGTIDEDEFRRSFFTDKRDFDFDGMKAAMVEMYDYLPGVEALLQELLEREQPMHLLSNYPSWYKLIEEKLRLSRYAPWTFVSCNTGVRKPHPDAYLGPAKALRVEPDRLIFVDDRGNNCKAAAVVGVDAIKFVDAAALRAALVSRGIL